MIIKVFQKKSKFFRKKLNQTEKNITDEDLIVKQVNTCFTKIGPKLANSIQASALNFASFMEKVH